MMAGSTVVASPDLIFYGLLQNYLIEAIKPTGPK
jgi:ABC-type glycerol-3-phosphate transport system permease component